MKYILKMILATITLLVVLPFFLIPCLWSFKFEPVKRLLSDYHLIIARGMWDAFRINWY